MVKEFEELPSIYQFPIEMQNIILRIQKDAWNAAIKWAAENVKLDYSTLNVYKVKKESILKGLIK